ncbi:MAG TPA: hypothetical protein PKU80_01090 [Candidatus Limiplasma sp.]|nr:hypothetical protein [Candidatus Limiplasma sp.]HRX09781.1 hypothetical protein [Candidatus Limiplasma sp.]
MPKVIRRLFAFALLLLWLPAGALALTGQTFSTFQTYYRENVSFINDNEGRHMLPIELSMADLNDNGRKQYSVYSVALNVTVTVDGEGIIETCEIRLIYPEGAQQGNSLYLDYVTAQYHSLAFIMAMHVSPTPDSRYFLADEIRNELRNNFGAYERQLGSYTISCVSVAGEGAVFTFTNNSLTPALDDPWDGGPTPEPLDDSEHLG